MDLRTTQLVYIAQGATKLVARGADDRDQILAFHFAPDFVLVPALAAHAYSVHALTVSGGLLFDYDRLLALADRDCGALGGLLCEITRALSRCREKTIALGRKSAAQRVAMFLFSMAERLGQVEDGVTVFSLPMPRRDVADSVGLTIETVSRQITNLRDAGVISTCGRSSVRVLDPVALRARAGFVPRPDARSKFALDQ